MSPPLPHRETVAMLYAWAQVLATLDLPALIAAIDRAETIGPLVDPTLFRARADAMREDRQVLIAASKLRDIGLRVLSHDPARGRLDH